MDEETALTPTIERSINPAAAASCSLAEEFMKLLTADIVNDMAIASNPTICIDQLLRHDSIPKRFLTATPYVSLVSVANTRITSIKTVNVYDTVHHMNRTKGPLMLVIKHPTKVISQANWMRG
jgi:hypothetical protein